MDTARRYRLTWLMMKKDGYDQTPPWVGGPEPDLSELPALLAAARSEHCSMTDHMFGWSDDRQDWVNRFGQTDEEARENPQCPNCRRPRKTQFIDAPDCPLGCTRHPAWLRYSE